MKPRLLLSSWLLLIVISASPILADEPNARLTKSERGQKLLQKAEIEVFQLRYLSNDKSKVEHQRRIRPLVEKARETIEPALEEHVAAFRKFPAFIDEEKQPKLRAERVEVETSMILESLNLAKCTYLEAQTYDAKSLQFKQLLNQAAEEYETIYLRYRTQMGGLYACLWQAKCCEELGEPDKALGIYSELLDLPGDREGLQNLKSHTLLFKLICLNSTEEWQLVVDLAKEWLDENTADSKTSVGLGILWEQARSLEALGDEEKLSKPDQDRHWRRAKTAALQINRFPGQHKDLSLTMVQRLQAKLKENQPVPEDFGTAYVLGRQAFNHAQETKAQWEAATRSRNPTEDLEKLRQDFTNNLNEAAGHFERAMTLLNQDDDSRDVAMSRLLQAYTYYYLRRNYEAAIIAQFLARTAKEGQQTIGIDAAYMAMASLVQAYYDNKVEFDQKLDDMKLIIEAAKFIVDRWPESDKANDACMILGGMYRDKKPIEAAKWFLKIPETDPKFPEAQLSAGSAFWIAHGAAGRFPPEAQPTPETLNEWTNAAKRHLRVGIGMWAVRNRNRREVPSELIRGKISLAEIMLAQGHPAEAVRYLVNDPQSVVAAVAVADETQRPSAGIQSRAVAKSVHQLLLRAYIGMGAEKLDDARETMKTLESILSGDPNWDPADLDQFRAELKRLADE